jgi:LPS-assembly lipoprotein
MPHSQAPNRKLHILTSRRPFLLGAFSALLVALYLTLSGCGLYQTKKAIVPYKAVAVTGPLSPELLYQLQFHILTFINIKVAIHPKDADLILEIIQEVPNSQILSYTGTGQVSAFGLTDAVTFRAVDVTGKVVIPESEIYVVRDINFSVSTVLSAEIQQQQMMTDMRKELAMQITRRLIALGRIGP